LVTSRLNKTPQKQEDPIVIIQLLTSSVGIGRAIARHFASHGHKIFILDVNADNIKHTAEIHLKEHTANVGWAQCDLRSVKDIRSTIDKAVDFLGGRIDHLINNAGISHPYWPDGKTMADPDVLEKWQAYIETNLTGAFVMSQAVIPYMKVDKDAEKQKLPNSKVGTAGPCIIVSSAEDGVDSSKTSSPKASSVRSIVC
jgi:NAD(P)-dependent dehydrogenase (short-subunit alcohol dehydrogenase family)